MPLMMPESAFRFHSRMFICSIQIWNNFSLHFSEAFAIIVFDATVAQLVEQLIRNQQVRGSSPLSSLKKLTGGQLFFLYRCSSH